MDRIIEYRAFKGYFIYEFLTEKNYTNSLVKRLIKSGGISINNNIVNDRRCFVNEGDFVVVSAFEDSPSDKLKPSHEHVKILYEDDDIIAADKPAGMPVHISSGNYDNTLSNALLNYFSGQNFIFRAVNRPDKYTSGVVLVAKNIISGSILQNDVKNKNVKRVYYGVVSGLCDGEGVVNAPIGRKCGSIIERCVDYENGDYAITHYKNILSVNKNGSALSLIEFNLQTGRTHQIRVHMKHIGYPIIGDFLYNPDYRFISRQALHCSSITFNHPITKKPTTISSPLPDDILWVIKD